MMAKTSIPSLRLLVVMSAVALLLALLISCQKTPEQLTAPPSQHESLDDLSAINVSVSQNLDKVKEVQKRQTNGLLKIDNVIGTGVTAFPEGGYAIKIMTQKAGMENSLPKVLEGVPIIVANIGKVNAHDVFTERYRPVECGVSGGSYNYYRSNQHGYIYDGGTIGCVVQKAGKKYFLSNNHVFAHANREPIGAPVVQPGLIDVGGVQNPEDIVANLSAFNRILFGALRNTNVIDAAIAEIQPGIEFNCAMISGYTPSTVVATAEIGMPVKKTGRTTGLTFGEVTDVNVTIVVNYGLDGKARFDNQIGFTDIADSGDSGSLVVTESGNQPLGLEFAGSDVASFGNPIQAVLDYFGVQICGD